MSFEQFADVIQSTFYLVAGTVAVLTYRAAKRGLLNTVNTEYQKRAMDRIAEVSDTLIEEFLEESDAHWAKKEDVATYLQPIQHEFQEHSADIIAKGKFDTGIPHPAEAIRLEDLIQRLQSDPFLPAPLRKLVVGHLERRYKAFFTSYMEEVRRYCTELAEGRHGKDFRHDAGVVHNRIVERMYAEGCGISQLQEQVHQVRMEFQRYLDSFNPFPGMTDRKSERLLTG